MYWLLTYDYVDDIVTRRAAHREAHLALGGAFQERGALLMAGAVGDPVDGALLVFKADDASVVDEYVEQDPYVKEGLVTAWQVRPWNVVVGGATRGTTGADATGIGRQALDNEPDLGPPFRSRDVVDRMGERGPDRP